MNIASASAAPATNPITAYSTNTLLAQVQSSASVTSALLSGGAVSSSTDSSLTDLMSAAVDYSMYAAPGLMQHMVQAGMMSGGTAAAGQSTGTSSTTADASTAASTTPAPAAPQFAFNPFDSSSWWSSPTGTGVDTTA